MDLAVNLLQKRLEMSCDVHVYNAPKNHRTAKIAATPEQWAKLTDAEKKEVLEQVAAIQAKWRKDQVEAIQKSASDHAAHVAAGVANAMEIVVAHGTKGNAKTPCGYWTPAGFPPLKRSTWIQYWWNAATGSTCHWVVADNSCYSGLGVKAVQSANYTGVAQCKEGTAHDDDSHCFHAGWESDNGFGASTADAQVTAMEIWDLVDAMRLGNWGAFEARGGTAHSDEGWFEHCP